MAKKDYTKLAEEIVAAVGGKSNITSVANCMTRLRLVLKDDSIPDDGRVKAIKGVQGVMKQGGQYQIVIGTHVSDVKPFVEQVLGGAIEVDEVAENVKKDNLFNLLMKTISGCITPMLGLLVGSGILKGILAVCTTAGVLTTNAGTYQVLYAAADAVLYFMPIIVGFSAGKVFGGNQYLTAVVGGALLYPNLISALAQAEEAGAGLTFFHLPITNASYSSTLLPIIMAAFVAVRIEKLCKKYIPQMLQLMFVPAITLGVTVPLSWLVIGPIMNAVSSAISGVIMTVYGLSPVLGSVIFGAFWQLFVLLGLHTALSTVLFVDFFTTGESAILGILGVTVWALAGVSLGYALKKKNSEQRSLGFGNLASCLCGITEPTIYSICLEDKKCFLACFIGGGIGGGILGVSGAKMYAMAGDGIFKLPAMVNPAGLDISFYSFIIAALVAMGVAAVVTFLLVPAVDGEKAGESGISAAMQPVMETDSHTVYAPVAGKIVAQSDIPDETFASGILGQGIGIDPSEAVIVAPFNGTISAIVDTKHAVGITSEDGVEVLVHIGIDTVKMNGDGFSTLVKEGDTVRIGQKLITFDKEKIKAAGYSPVTVVLVGNSSDYERIQMSTGEVKQLDKVIQIG